MEADILELLGVLETDCIGTTSSSPYSGSPTYEEIPFHVNGGCNPMNGSFVVVERDENKILHYGRIVKGTEENPKADPSGLQKNLAYNVGQKDPRPGDSSPFVTRILSIEVLGELFTDDGQTIKIKDPGLLAQTGKGVYLLPVERIPWLFNIPESKDEGLNIGEIESGEKAVDFNLPLQAVARHLVIVGKSGVGKSYAVGVGIEELVKKDIPIIAFDVLGDTFNVTEDLHGLNYYAGRDYRVPYSIIGAAEFRNFLPGLTEDQEEIIVHAYNAIHGRALAALEETGQINMPYQALLNEIEEVGNAFGQAGVATRAKTKVEGAFRRSHILTESTGEWLEQFQTQPIVNVFIGHLSQRDRNLVVGATARMLQMLRKAGKVPPFVFVLDEAHFFLPSGGEMTPSTSVIRELIRTARHDAIGIIVVTQSPSSMDRQVLLTCNTRIVFALDKDDFRVVAGTMGDLPDEIVNRIPKLPQGQAIISSGLDIMRHSSIVKIRIRVTREGAPTPNLAAEVKKWRRTNQQ